MFEERVSIIEPNSTLFSTNVIFVAPHGNQRDDINTSFIAEAAAKKCNGYAVINKGWKKSIDFNYEEEHANCNNIKHLREDVVKEEFFDPIINFACRILKIGYVPYICLIHGMATSARTRTRISTLDILLGNGRGRRITAPDDFLQSFSYYLSENALTAYVAGEKTGYSGRSENNLNQAFSDPNLYQHSLHRPNTFRPRLPIIPSPACGIPAYSVQLEIVHAIRDSEDIAAIVGEYIGDAIRNSFMKYNQDIIKVKNHPLKLINFNF